MKSFTTKHIGAGKLAKIQKGFGKTARYAVSLCSIVAMSAVGSEAFASTPLNHPPTDITITSTNIDELQSSGTLVGALSSIDQDVNDTDFIYTLVAGAGDEDNASFTLDLNKLRSTAMFDYATKSSYNIRIQTEDQEGNTYQKAITVSVKHLPPTVGDLSKAVVGGDTISFEAYQFSDLFTVPNHMMLNTAKINTLPSDGVLELNGSAITAGTTIALADLSNLKYISTAGYNGYIELNWNADDATGTYAVADGKIKIYVRKPRTVASATDVMAPVGGPIRDTSAISTLGGDTLSNGTNMGGTRPSSTTGPDGSLSRLGNTSGGASIAGIEENNTAPEILIHNCYPNPFTQGATIKYQLPMDGKVEIKVYNAAGVEVSTLSNEQQSAGVHTAAWAGKNNGGVSVGAGQYYYFISVKDAKGAQVSTNSGVMIKL